MEFSVTTIHCLLVIGLPASLCIDPAQPKCLGRCEDQFSRASADPFSICSAYATYLSCVTNATARCPIADTGAVKTSLQGSRRTCKQTCPPEVCGNNSVRKVADKDYVDADTDERGNLKSREVHPSEANKTSMADVGTLAGAPRVGRSRSPGKARKSPGWAGVPLGVGGRSKDSAEKSLGKAWGSIGTAGTSPGTAGRSPGTAGRSPGTAGRSPGTTGRSPGTAGRSPGTARRSPGTAGTQVKGKDDDAHTSVNGRERLTFQETNVATKNKRDGPPQGEKSKIKQNGKDDTAPTDDEYGYGEFEEDAGLKTGADYAEDENSPETDDDKRQADPEAIAYEDGLSNGSTVADLVDTPEAETQANQTGNSTSRPSGNNSAEGFRQNMLWILCSLTLCLVISELVPVRHLNTCL